MPACGRGRLFSTFMTFDRGEDGGPPSDICPVRDLFGLVRNLFRTSPEFFRTGPTNPPTWLRRTPDLSGKIPDLSGEIPGRVRNSSGFENRAPSDSGLVRKNSGLGPEEFRTESGILSAPATGLRRTGPENSGLARENSGLGAENSGPVVLQGFQLVLHFRTSHGFTGPWYP